MDAAANAAAAERTYGEGFSSGFARFKHTQEFWDVTVSTGTGEWKLHSLLLASRSEFFYRALAGQFAESRSKCIELHLEKAPGEEVWPLLVDYFYRDSITITQHNVCPLLALSRQLLVTPVCHFCTEFIGQHLTTANCISYLRQAERYHLHDIQQQAVALAAQGFHLLYDSDVSGLPASTVLDVLQHQDLLVHCEQQVMRFVLRYLNTTEVEPGELEDVCNQVRFLYLDNKSLASLRHTPQLPKDLLLSGSLMRLDAMDTETTAAAAAAVGGGSYNSGGCGGGRRVSNASSVASGGAGAGGEEREGAGGAMAVLEPPPRDTYCCDLRYGLPGGSTTLTVQLEDIWQHVAPLCRVIVSGVSEGVPENVLSSDPEAWFETDESADPLPWIQVVLPSNMRVVHFNRYTYSHGHRRSGYFRLRNWQTLTAADEGGPFAKIHARPSVNEPFDVNVARQDQETPWRSIKLVGTDRQEDAVFRLCVRNLRLFGRAEVDLMKQGDQQALELTRQLVDQIKSSGAAYGSIMSSSTAAAARPSSSNTNGNNNNAAAAAAAGDNPARPAPGAAAGAAAAAAGGAGFVLAPHQRAGALGQQLVPMNPRFAGVAAAAGAGGVGGGGGAQHPAVVGGGVAV